MGRQEVENQKLTVVVLMVVFSMVHCQRGKSEGSI